MEFQIPSINILVILPVIITLSTGVLIMLLDMFIPEEKKQWAPWLTAIGLALALAQTVGLWGYNGGTFTPEGGHPMLVLDGFASFLNVIFLLTGLLLARLAEADQARVITMSSGGMYTSPLRVGSLEMSREDYRGSEQYARAKRAQVTLNEMWPEHAPANVHFHALHPGWADTPGVRESLPTFRRVVGPLLRTPEQGVDTLLWLIAGAEAIESTGLFWHDRRPRAIHRLGRTRRSDTPQRRQELWDLVVAESGYAPD